MAELKTIFLPTDGSECSAKAMQYALSLAKQYGARVVGLHIIDREWEGQVDRARAGVGEEVLQRVRAAHAEEARRIVQEAADAATQAGVPVETKLVRGHPSADIVRLGKDLPADLIVMGTHGRRGMSHLLIGSVAERVVRQAPCPVLTVRLTEPDSVVP